ncbi:DUF3995 domain-containing protein [Lysinibacillus piscis]|uniref:DUF3995 domain-containing protein n=1 Tax=Lysinibacillus piscis TaxID=2518931 RepID=UPI0022325E0F|nr:DUF3995 domain-containing protein [Lysinibacillus sp. KH24]
MAISILWLIGCLHIYWAFGGRKRCDTYARRYTTSYLYATGMVTGIVGCLLWLAGLLLLIQGGYLYSFPANKLSKIGSIVCGIVIGLRAIRDFHYVGFFKRICHSTFASYDTWLYSPLCLFLSIVYLFMS